MGKIYFSAELENVSDAEASAKIAGIRQKLESVANVKIAEIKFISK